MTFEEELNEAREEGREEGRKMAGQEMPKNVISAFTMFRDGKSDEEIFQTERFSSMEEIRAFRDIWKAVRQSDNAQ